MINPVMFHDYWKKENELLEISLKQSLKQAEERKVCEWCGERGTRIEVHGHYQCSKCGKNVDECCQGEIV